MCWVNLLLLHTLQADEAAQAVAQWSALRSSCASPPAQQRDQAGQPSRQQHQQLPRSRLHEPSLQMTNSATHDFGAQYDAQLTAQVRPWSYQQQQSTQPHQLQQDVQQQQGQRPRLQVCVMQLRF
jgi:hypothetical protein